MSLRQWLKRSRRRLEVAVGAAALLVPVVATFSIGTANAAGAPAGKSYWQFAVSSINDTSGAPTQLNNFARTGAYTFNPDGTVLESFWYWNQQNTGQAVNTEDAGCPTGCTVLTAPNYVTGTTGYPKPLSGTWVQGTSSCSGVCIQWAGSGGTENWAITNGTGAVAKMALMSASYMPSGKSGTGWAYGSNEPLATTFSAPQLLAQYPKLFSGHYCSSSQGNAETCGTSSVNLGGWQSCASACITSTIPAAQSKCNPSGDDKFFLGTSGSAPRKVYYEIYCLNPNNPSVQCAGTTNSPHTDAWREIIGDDHLFHGFVGVEASLYSTAGMDTMNLSAYTDLGY